MNQDVYLRLFALETNGVALFRRQRVSPSLAMYAYNDGASDAVNHICFRVLGRSRLFVVMFALVDGIEVSRCTFEYGITITPLTTVVQI